MTTLREIQDPLKQRYRVEPEAAQVTLSATGQLGDGVSCSINTGRAMAEAGLHPATGGDGTQLCSGDMLLEALVACAGVTLGAVAASLGPGLGNAAIAMVLVWWPVYARLMRAQVLEVKEREHVEAAIAAGARPRRVLFTHILPLCWTPVLISATMDLGQVVLLAASLSFIGLGATPPTPEWGSMISDGAVHFYQWWIAFGPGVAILTIVLGFNFIGDGLRDILDPRSD